MASPHEANEPGPQADAPTTPQATPPDPAPQVPQPAPAVSYQIGHVSGTGHIMGPNGVMHHHGPDLERIRSLIQELVASSRDPGGAPVADPAIAAEAATIDAELEHGRVDRLRVLALLDRVTASVGGVAAAGTAAAQLAQALQGF
ncbi:hypothetical protein DMH25_39445 [Streptomyces sp. WAC 01325]|nr:hypothetical protein DMH25_39445 [Streptomyces sp. WAC 01325]